MNQNSPTCLSTHLDRQLSVCLPSICQSIIYYLPNLFIIYLAIYLTSTHLSIHQSCHLMYHLSVLSIICLFIDRSSNLSIYLPVIYMSSIHLSVVSDQGWLCPPTRGHMTMSGDISGWGRGSSWHLMGGDQRSCSTARRAQHAPHLRVPPAPDVSSAEVEKTSYVKC